MCKPLTVCVSPSCPASPGQAWPSWLKGGGSGDNPQGMTETVSQMVPHNLVILKSSWLFSTLFCALHEVTEIVGHCPFVKSFSFGCHPHSLLLFLLLPRLFYIILFTAFSVFLSHLGLVFPRIMVYISFLIFFSCIYFLWAISFTPGASTRINTIITLSGVN